MRLCLAIRVCLAIQLVVGSGDIASQPKATRIPEESGCAVCSIEITRTTKLVHPEGAAATFPVSGARDQRGRYWIFWRDDLPTVYDGAGAFQRRFGAKGRGPGEYMAPYALFPAGDDSLVLLDRLTRRATVISTASMALGRSVALPLLPHGAAVGSWPDRVYSSGSIPGADQIGWSLHQLSFASASVLVRGSFGAGNGDARPQSVLTTWHSLLRARDGSLLAAWHYGYDIHRFDSSGRVLESFERRPKWFPSTSPSRIGNPRTPPDPFVVDIGEDETGLVWVYIRVPHPGWRSAWPSLPPGTTEVPISAVDTERLFSTAVEVLDLKSGRVVARIDVDGFLVSAVGARSAILYRTRADGEPELVVQHYGVIGR